MRGNSQSRLRDVGELTAWDQHNSSLESNTLGFLLAGRSVYPKADALNDGYGPSLEALSSLSTDTTSCPSRRMLRLSVDGLISSISAARWKLRWSAQSRAHCQRTPRSGLGAAESWLSEFGQSSPYAARSAPRSSHQARGACRTHALLHPPALMTYHRSGRGESSLISRVAPAAPFRHGITRNGTAISAAAPHGRCHLGPFLHAGSNKLILASFMLHPGG